MFKKSVLLLIFCLSTLSIFAQPASNKTKSEKEKATDKAQPVSRDTTKTPVVKMKKAVIPPVQKQSKQTRWVKDIIGIMGKEKNADSIPADFKDTTKSPYQLIKEQKKEAIPLLIMRPVSGFGMSKLKDTWLLYLCEAYMYFKLGGVPVLRIVSPDTLSVLLTGYKDYKSAIPKERYKQIAGDLSVPYILYLQCIAAGKNVNFLGGISSRDETRSFASISEQFPLKDLAATLDKYAIRIVEEMGIESARQNRAFLDTPLASNKTTNLKKLGEFLSTVDNLDDKELLEFLKKYNDLLSKDSQLLVGYYAASRFCSAAGKYEEAAGFSHALVDKLGQKYPPVYISATRYYRLAKKYDMAIRVADLAKNLKEIQKPLQEEIILCEKEGEIEEVRAAEEARKTEEARIAEEARRAEEARKAEEARQAESEQRIEEARKAAEVQRVEKERRVEEAYVAKDARKAEEERRAEESRRAEEERKAEKARIAKVEKSVIPTIQPKTLIVEKPTVTPTVRPRVVTEEKTKQDPTIKKGIEMVKQKNYKEAIDIFTKLIESEKTTSEMLFWTFRAYSLSGNFDMGEKVFMDNIINPNSPWSLLTQGELDESRSYFFEAMNKYQKVFEKDPKNQYAASSIGRIELLRGDHEKALEFFSKAYAFNPNDMQYLLDMGKCYEGMNQDENALDIYEEVLSSTQDFPEALEGAERIKKKLGLQSKAEQERIAKEKVLRVEEEGKAEEAKKAEKERKAEEARKVKEAEEAEMAEQEALETQTAETEFDGETILQDEETILQQDSITIVDELKKLAELRDNGVISEEDFLEFKKKLLSQ